VAIEGEIEQAYLESMGITQQQQPALTGTATLDSTTHPGDKVEQQATPDALEPEQPPQPNSPKMPVLTNYPSVLIYGAPGSGKTTFAEQESASLQPATGNNRDPHAAYVLGWDEVSARMDYAAIDASLNCSRLRFGAVIKSSKLN
jgi:Cdc6-like AAA superfamily ATPase